MKIFRALFLLVLFFAARPAAFAQGYTTPGVGSPLRKAVLDVLRESAAAHYGQKIVFQVSTLRVSEKWAFFIGTAQQPNGAPVDFRLAPAYKGRPRAMKEEMDAGVLFGGVDALLKKTAQGWRVVEVVYEAGDVHWLDYPQRFGVPAAMLKLD